MKRASLFIAVLSILAISGGLVLLWANGLRMNDSVIWPLNYKNYTFQNYPTTALDEAPPQISPMPDLKKFTVAALIDKIPALESGTVRIAQMKNNVGFDKFTEIRRQNEFSALQNRKVPLGIEISSGVYDIESLYTAVNDNKVLSRDKDTYLLNIPVYVGPGATLIIRGGNSRQRTTLKLSSNTGAFLVNGGKLFIVDSDIIGWNEKKRGRSTFETDRKFRPFLTSWSASETYLARSGFYDLGYAASKSYGISFSSLKPLLKNNPLTPAPRGWLMNCHFEGIYYGFYSYEAEYVALIDNVYANNIVYGIDPHDRSKHLLIAGNEAYGTKKKHGIIFSREVNDSWIVKNYSHDNRGSGFMLDRSSVRNLVANNLAFRNGNDGLTLFESGNNLIVHNKFIMNSRSGLRVRNSSNVIAENNLYLLNKTNGAQAYAFDITETEDDRDFEEDPFVAHVSIAIRKSFFAFNKGAMFKFNNIDLLRLSDIRFLWYEPRMIRGDFQRMTHDLAVAMRHPPHYVEVRKDGLPSGDTAATSIIKSGKNNGDNSDGNEDESE